MSLIRAAALCAGIIISGAAMAAPLFPASPVGSTGSANEDVILVRGGHGHGHHYGWGRGRGHHYGWYHGRHRGWR